MFRWSVATVATCLLAGMSHADIPRFQDPVLVETGGVPIDVGSYSAPVMFDWNQDGKKDIVIGQLTAGMIRFFRNVGDDSAPAFSTYRYLKADGTEINLPYG